MPQHSPEYLAVALQGVGYLADPAEYRRTTVPILREQFDQSGEAGEQSLHTQTWLRSQTDWSFGGGQGILDNEDSDRRRFNTSAGIDPWTKGQVSLLPECETKNNANAWTSVRMKRLGQYLYVASGTNLYYASNPEAADASVVWNQVSALVSPETIEDFTSDGADVFIAYGASRFTAKVALGSTSQPADLGSLNPEWLEVVGGRLIFGYGQTIAEMQAGGAAAASFTLPHSGGSWVGACAATTGIYAAANDFTGSVYFLAVDPTSGLLQEPQQVAELPSGETINQISFYGGVLVLATSEGLRVAAIDTTSNGITYGPAIEDGGEAFSLTVGERFVWWGGAAGQTYRADLSRFTEPLVPAWTTDLLSVGDGNALGNVTWIARLGGRTFFVDAGNGVQGPESTGALVPSGTLSTGDVRWNSHFSKVMRTVEVRASPTEVVAGNITYDDAADVFDDADVLYNGLGATVAGTIEVQFVTDTGITTDLQALTDRVETVVTPTISSGRWTPTFTLTRDAVNTDGGPVLESWTMQAFVAPTRIDEILLPIVLRRRVVTSRGVGRALTQDPQGIFDTLRTLMVDATVCTYEEGERSELVKIDQMELRADKLADNGDWWEGLLVVRLLTVPT